jgi:hypothetical protein
LPASPSTRRWTGEGMEIGFDDMTILLAGVDLFF